MWHRTTERNTQGHQRVARIGIAWLVLAIVVSVALTATACALLLPDREPAILSRPGEVTTVTVSTQQYSGSRQVSVTPVLSEAQQLTTTAVGTITEVMFTGGTLNSGTVIMRVDDNPVVALHTDVPLYRDLALDMTGADVQALNRELGRLGLFAQHGGDPESNRYTWATQMAVQSLMVGAGIGDGYDGATLALRNVVWLPDQSDTVSNWQPRRGRSLAPGAVIGTIAGTLTRLDVAGITASAQPRVLIVAGVTVTLPAEKTNIEDRKALDQVQASDQYRQQIGSATGSAAASPDGSSSGSGIQPLAATLSLDKPIEVLRVPAAAVFGLDGTTGCVASAGKSIPVSVVGSELGVSLVTLDGGASNFPSTVDIGSAIAGRQCK